MKSFYSWQLLTFQIKTSSQLPIVHHAKLFRQYRLLYGRYFEDDRFFVRKPSLLYRLLWRCHVARPRLSRFVLVLHIVVLEGTHRSLVHRNALSHLLKLFKVLEIVDRERWQLGDAPTSGLLLLLARAVELLLRAVAPHRLLQRLR